MLLLLEGKDLVCFKGPISLKVKTAHLYAIDQIVRLDPASLAAGPSSGNLTAPGQSLQHSLDVVVAVGRFLASLRTYHAFAHQKDAHGSFGTLTQIERQTKGIVARSVP
jgi:hypothetical protein